MGTLLLVALLVELARLRKHLRALLLELLDLAVKLLKRLVELGDPSIHLLEGGKRQLLLAADSPLLPGADPADRALDPLENGFGVLLLAALDVGAAQGQRVGKAVRLLSENHCPRLEPDDTGQRHRLPGFVLADDRPGDRRAGQLK